MAMTTGSARTRARWFRPLAFTPGQFALAWLLVGNVVAIAGAAVLYVSVPPPWSEPHPALVVAQWFFLWPILLSGTSLIGLLVLLWWASLALLLTLGTDRLLGRLASRT